MANEPVTMAQGTPDMAPEIEVSHKADEKSHAISKSPDPEIGSVDEPSKTYYSKLSVWLMILFSGLAIG
jgi:hypothetical protein